MKILIIEPGKLPREAEIDGSLESMQKTVGGYLQAIYPFEDEVALVCDDESKLKSDTQWNRMLPETGDIIKGTFFIAGLGAEDFTDLSAELMEKYRQRFRNVELFIPTPNGLMPIVMKGCQPTRSPVTAGKNNSEYHSNLKSNATNRNVVAAFLLS